MYHVCAEQVYDVCPVVSGVCAEQLYVLSDVCAEQGYVLSDVCDVLVYVLRSCPMYHVCAEQ